MARFGDIAISDSRTATHWSAIPNSSRVQLLAVLAGSSAA